MSILFFNVVRSGTYPGNSESVHRLQHFAQSLYPGNPTTTVLHRIEPDGAAIIDPAVCSVRENSFVFNTFGPDQPLNGNGDCPTNAGFRYSNTAEQVSLSANLVASRTIWYYFDREQLIVSGSQRAIAAALGSFELNPQALSWMLATGNLGPGNAWDRRVKHLLPGQTIILNKRTWSLSSRQREDPGEVPPGDSAHYLDHLDEIFKDVFGWTIHEKPDRRSVLTLSGGYDSRAVLYNYLRFNHKLPTVTWGLSAARTKTGTDAQVAAAVAGALNISNRYFETDFRETSFDPLLNRFLVNGEGRIDHLNAFMDGFRMWDQLQAEGMKYIIRADEAFGWLPAQNEQDVRISLDFHRMEDNSNMLSLESFGMERQQVPAHLEQRIDETLEMWRDRLYREFRIPYVLTGLHTLIQPQFEVINPLLNDRFIRFSKNLPDEFRTGKNLYIRYVKSIMPDRVPIATEPSIPEPAAILRSARIVSLLLDEMQSADGRNLAGSKFINWIETHMKVDDSMVNLPGNTFATWIKSHTPWQLKKLLRRDLIRYKADFNQLAFRLVIATRMIRIIKEDTRISSGTAKI